MLELFNSLSRGDKISAPTQSVSEIWAKIMFEEGDFDKSEFTKEERAKTIKTFAFIAKAS